MLVQCGTLKRSSLYCSSEALSLHCSILLHSSITPFCPSYSLHSSNRATECGGHTSLWVRVECLMDSPRSTSQCPPSTVLHSVLEGGGRRGGLTQHLWTCQHHVPNNRTCSRDTVHCDCDSPQQCGEVGRCH